MATAFSLTVFFLAEIPKSLYHGDSDWRFWNFEVDLIRGTVTTSKYKLVDVKRAPTNGEVKMNFQQTKKIVRINKVM